MKEVKTLTIGIDATNLRGGGGVTHLLEFLRVAQPAKFGIDRVVVWGGSTTLALLEDRPWLHKCNPPALDRGLFQRTVWQGCRLSQAARNAGCDALFVPGGSYVGNFHPAVTMSRNLLPFEMRELRRFGWSLTTVRFLLLRWLQSYAFKHVEGMIFLTQYARDVVLNCTGTLPGQVSIISHGLHPRFRKAPKGQCTIDKYDEAHPYRVLYVSSIDQYKHQWHVVEAVAALRRQGLPIVLDLVGPPYSHALKRLTATLAREDANGHWVHCHGAMPFVELHHKYAEADLGLFASSCENMPNILLETMASGLPIACSGRGPMPEVLGDAGVYFDPEQPSDIARALRKLVDSAQLRTDLANASYERSQQFSWQRCADETLAFIAQLARKNGDSQCVAS